MEQQQILELLKQAKELGLEQFLSRNPGVKAQAGIETDETVTLDTDEGVTETDETDEESFETNGIETTDEEFTDPDEEVTNGSGE